MSRERGAVALGGRAAIGLMTSGRARDLAAVRHYLDGAA